MIYIILKPPSLDIRSWTIEAEVERVSFEFRLWTGNLSIAAAIFVSFDCFEDVQCRGHLPLET